MRPSSLPAVGFARPRGRRPGFALPLVLGALVIVAGMLAGMFLTSTLEARIGTGAVDQERATRASELGVDATLANWNSTAMSKLANGASVTQVYDSSGRGYIDSVMITRLNKNAFWVASIGNSLSAGASAGRRRTNLAVRLSYPSFNFLGALTVRGNISIAGSSYITGIDTPPNQWSCPPAAPELPAVAAQTTGSVTLNGCTNLKCLNGNPDILASTAAGDTTTYFNYGDANWATLTSLATVAFPSSSYTLNGIGPTYAADGSCQTSNTQNWGDDYRAIPSKACESYFPIIYFPGTSNTIHITGGRGQGILLVDGNLTIDGGFEFDGPVIIRGSFTTQGTGAHITGGVMAADVNLQRNTVAGNAIVSYSSCAVQAAIVGSGRVRPLMQRSWADLY